MKKNIALIVLATLLVYSCSLLAWRGGGWHGGWRGGWGWGGGPAFGFGFGAPYAYGYPYYGYPYYPYYGYPGVGLGFTFNSEPKTPEYYKAKTEYETAKAKRKAEERAARHQ